VPAFAQDYPSKPIKLIIPYPPGGATDVIGRIVALKMSEALGQQLVSEGRKDARVATILCDTGFRYLSSLYNAEWLAAKGLPILPWLRPAA